MADKTETTAPAAETKPAGKKIFCFICKHDIDEADAVEMPYVNGQKVWVKKDFVHFKN